MAKRGSRKPERASTRPPARPRSSWPKDNRPPKQGKGGSPLATGEAIRKGGTSVSGKPIGDADLAKIPSSETPRATRGRKSKGKVEEPEQKFERRTLTTAEQQEMAMRAVRLSVEVRRRKRKLQRDTKTERDAIKEVEKQAEQLETQADQGYELVPEGDIFADRVQDRREEEAGAATPTPGQADAALGEIAKRVGGNGSAEPVVEAKAAPLVVTQAFPRGVDVEPLDDIDRAAAREARA